MEHKNHDQVFFINFGMVMGALVALFFLFIFIARILVSGDDAPDDAERERVEDRIKPVGMAVTDPAMLLKMSASKPARAPYTGEQVVTRVCSACHGSGLLNAPKIGDHAEWNKRKAVEGGLDGLVAAAIKGENAMPPRGGDTDLSDEEVRMAVELLMK